MLCNAQNYQSREVQVEVGVVKKTLGITIPKKIADSNRIKEDDFFDIKIKKMDPLIIPLKRRKEEEW